MADMEVMGMEPPSKKMKMDQITNLKQEVSDEVRDFTEDDFPSTDNFTVSEDKYTNYVSPSELDKLREFQVLDEVKSDDENSNDDSESSDGSAEVPEEEIEKMLEEDLPEGFKGAPKPKEKPYTTTQKVVLEEKGVNQFEVLPLDWVMVRHFSGIPVYVHRNSRVCTLSKPYFLGKGNTRRHDIPVSAIPCLAYRKALEEEEKQKEIDKEIEEQIRSGTWQQNVNNNQASTSVNAGSSTNTNTSKCPYNHRKKQNETANTSKKPASINPNNDSETAAAEHNPHNDTSNNNVQETNVLANAKSSQTNDDARKLTNENSNESKPNVSDDLGAHLVNTNENLDSGNDRNVHEMKYSATNGLGNQNKLSNPLEAQDAVVDDNILVIKMEVDTDESNVDNGPSNTTEEPAIEENAAATEETAATEENTAATEENTAEARETNVQRPEIPLNRQPVVLPGGIVMPPPRVETVSTSWKTQHLTPEQVNDYCKKLFKFKTISIMHFMSWADRRKYMKARKALQYPTLPDGTKLITIPAQPANGQDNGGKANKRDWVMNMNGRSYLSVFHEYAKRALQKQPVYEFKQLENSSTPYQATVFIGGMQYGVGHGSSKRSAKSAAARASIHILIPEMRHELEPAPDRAPDRPAADRLDRSGRAAEPDFSFFDYVSIEDPRITEFCAATCEPSPHAILRTCLLRNFGAGGKQIHTEMKKLEFHKIELTMTVGKHSATVVCKNKKTAKQRASQAILQALHPHVRSWGSLLRLYGSRSVKSCKEKKLEEQQITLLQDAARHNEPNYAVLEKLRNEMRNLRERDEAVVPIGTLLVQDDLPTHSGSNLNNVDL